MPNAHPLMVLDGADAAPAEPHPLVRVLDAEDPFLAAALAVPHVAFATPRTAVGTPGPGELATVVGERAGEPPAAAERVRAGRTVLAAAVEDGAVLCSGMQLPVGRVTEVAGVGTLPAARRRGLALAVTAALVADAGTRGVDTVSSRRATTTWPGSTPASASRAWRRR
ncbi:hypothetical protein [Streptomyces sp. NPDC005548]|uniref:hypothetical protein n=1 Tax=Streptomyces sp. NPDC005548 TaxID=3364724 RepID=UPI0036821221